METNVQKNDLFLSRNGQGIAAFATDAKMAAKRVAPGDSLRLDLDFRWALSDLKVGAAAPEQVNKK
jgi:hypothetical protein